MINLKDHPKYFLIFEKTSSTGSAILSHPQGETLITCERMNSICNETNLILQKSAWPWQMGQFGASKTWSVAMVLYHRNPPSLYLCTVKTIRRQFPGVLRGFMLATSFVFRSSIFSPLRYQDSPYKFPRWIYNSASRSWSLLRRSCLSSFSNEFAGRNAGGGRGRT